MSSVLETLDFEVHHGTNMTLHQIRRLIIGATKDPTGIETMLFFYAGHGVQMGGSNYLLASDADGTDNRSMRRGAIDIANIVQELSRFSTATVVLLDACRTNPFDADSFGADASQGQGGLTDFGLPSDSYVAFSTEPGRVALDGAGRNSPFTEALLRHIRTPDATIQDIMLTVRRDVADATGGAQVPWERSSLTRRVVFSTDEARQNTVQVSPAPQPSVSVSAQIYEITHEVRGLDPYGDGFLTLRVRPSAQSTEIRKLIEGTSLSRLGQEGAWMHVRLPDGQEGWVHTNWVAPLRGAVAPPQAAATVTNPQSCDALYYARNKIFHDHGYCFGSSRGQATFSNANCNPGLAAANVPLTSAERARIAELRAAEERQGC